MSRPLSAAEWLALLGANLSTRLPRGRAHLAVFARALAGDVPARWFTPAMAELVAPDLLALPTYSELLAAIRLHGSQVGTGAGRVDDRTEDDLWAERWFDYAERRIAECGTDRIPHLLSLLRQYSRPAWERFAGIHAPDVLRAHREVQADLAERRRLLPVPNKRAEYGFHRSRTPAEPAPAAPDFTPSTRAEENLTTILAERARAGDEWARERLEQRLGLRVKAPSP